jgi:hypothetical protein
MSPRISAVPFILPNQFLPFAEGTRPDFRDDLSATGDLDGSLCFTDLLNQRGAVCLELGDKNLLHGGLSFFGAR